MIAGDRCIDYNGTPIFAVSRVIFRDKAESRTAVGHRYIREQCKS